MFDDNSEVAFAKKEGGRKSKSDCSKRPEINEKSEHLSAIDHIVPKQLDKSFPRLGAIGSSL